MAPSQPRYRRNRFHFCCHRRSPNPGATSRWFPRTRSPSTRQHKGDQHGSNYGKLWKTMENCGSKINFDSTKQNTDDGEIADDYWSKSKTVFSASHLFAIYIYIHIYSLYMHMSCIQCMCIYIYSYIYICLIHSNPILKCLFHGSHGASQHTNTHRQVTWYLGKKSAGRQWDDPLRDPRLASPSTVGR